MAKIFAERKVTADTVLPIEDCKLYSDFGELKINGAKAERIIKRAEAALNEPIPMLSATMYLDFVRNGNRSRYEGPCFQRRKMLFELVIAEYCERSGRFTDKIADLVWAILEESTWTVPAHLKYYPTHNEFGLPGAFGENRMHGIDIFSAPTASMLALTYALVKKELDGVSEIIAQRIEYEIKNRIIKPYLNCSFWWSGEQGNTPNNWCPWTTSNVLFVTAIMEPDLYTRKRVVAKALRSLDTFTAGYNEDGGCDEGPGYWGGAGSSYFDCLELLYDMSGGEINVYDHPLVRAICEYIVKFNIDGKKRFINFADCAPSCHHDGTQIQRMGRKCSSDTLIPFGAAMAQIDDLKYPWAHTYRAMMNLMTETPEPMPSKADKKIWFPGLKVMIARESTDAARGLFVAMKGGSNNESHNHNDIGNIVVYNDGNPVLIDTGAGKYTKKTFSSERYTLWYMQSLYHNVAAFNGVGQKNGAKYVSSDEVYNEESGGVKMQLAGAYPKEAGVISYTRECVLGDNGITVTDEYELAEDGTADFRFITHKEPVIDGDKILLAEGRAMTYTAGKAEIESFPVGEENLERAWGTPDLWIIHVRCDGESGKVTFNIK